eukprot:5728849-Amphidinium_carterae.1
MRGDGNKTGKEIFQDLWHMAPQTRQWQKQPRSIVARKQVSKKALWFHVFLQQRGHSSNNKPHVQCSTPEKHGLTQTVRPRPKLVPLASLLKETSISTTNRAKSPEIALATIMESTASNAVWSSEPKELIRAHNRCPRNAGVSLVRAMDSSRRRWRDCDAISNFCNPGFCSFQTIQQEPNENA